MNAGACQPFIPETGTTKSGSTGPQGDHTNGAGYYLYAEANSGTPTGDEPVKYLLETPKLRYGKISYWYNMYSSGSAQMGSLHLDVLQGAAVSDGGSWTYDFIPPKVGDQGQSWVYQEVELSSITAPVKLRFRAEIGTGYRSDVALDDIMLHVAEPVADAPIVMLPEIVYVDQGVSGQAEIPMTLFNQGRDIGMLDIRGAFFDTACDINAVDMNAVDSVDFTEITVTV